MGSATGEERKIIVAVDEGEESLYALSWCLENMVSLGSDRTLTLLHVKRPAVVYPTIDRTDTINFHDAISSLDWRDRQIGRWAMEKAMKLCQGHESLQVKVEAKLEEGDPSDVICRMVDELKPDFLVMGSHGYGPINRKVRGSVSTDCVQRANCPVIVVKKPKRNA